MFLSPADLADLVAFRRRLHQSPELSGAEGETARAVIAYLRPTAPDLIVEGLGGHGVAFVYQGDAPGPTLMFRAELDALPIEELSDAPHRSQRPGKGHLCGHDGHMAALAALGLGLGRARPQQGRAVLLFQPAEETGAGARAVLADPKFAPLTPDLAFAWHNMPGLPLGRAALASGPVACASRGARFVLRGRTAHASTPDQGLSPMRALARLMPELAALGAGGALDERFRLVSITHAEMGARAFGVAPGEAEVWATLRTMTDSGMTALVEATQVLARRVAVEHGLKLEIVYEDMFAHCENAPEAVARVARALEAEGVAFDAAGLPMRASEDFGAFGAIAPTALLLIGAGDPYPGLHNADYDFPDALISVGARVAMRIARDALGGTAGMLPLSAPFDTLGFTLRLRHERVGAAPAHRADVRTATRSVGRIAPHARCPKSVVAAKLRRPACRGGLFEVAGAGRQPNTSIRFESKQTTNIKILMDRFCPRRLARTEARSNQASKDATDQCLVSRTDSCLIFSISSLSWSFLRLSS